MNGIINFLRRNPLCIFISKIIHWDDLKAWRIKRNNYIFKFREIKPRFYLPYYQNDYIQTRIYQNHNYFERKNLDYVCKQWKNGIVGKYIKGKNVLDIGTNIGNHTLYFFFECQINASYNFEPIENTLEIFKKNVQINNLINRVHIYNVAVGSNEGKANILSFNKDNIGATQLAINENGELPIISIDSLKLHDLIGLIKVDVEGFEIDALKGMKETLKRHKPYIIIEIKDELFENALNILSNLKYNYIKLDSFETYADYLFFQ